MAPGFVYACAHHAIIQIGPGEYSTSWFHHAAQSRNIVRSFLIYNTSRPPWLAVQLEVLLALKEIHD